MGRSQILAVLVLLTVNSALAEITYTGTFHSDDQMFSADFSLAASTNILVRTWSFAGGTDAAGQLIQAGGFAPVVSLFDSSGNLITFDDGGVAPKACGQRRIDAATGFCLDGYISGTFPPGTYQVVLTEWDNTPNGPTLGDGFVEEGNGNFTGIANLASGPFYLDAGPGFQRTGNWALDIPGAIPEPSYLFVMTGAGVLLCLQAIYDKLRSRERRRAVLAAAPPLITTANN